MTSDTRINFTKPRSDIKLTPWQVTGLTDGEGSFTYSITKTGLTRFKISLEFKVTQKTHSEGILYELKDYFGCGNVVIDNRTTDTKKYHVTSLQSILTNVIPHFDLYPCITSKELNYRDWKKIANMMNKKEHLNNEGVEQILSIVSQMNSKRSFDDKYNFCKTVTGLTRDENNGNLSVKLDLPADWVQGFLTGESLFYIYINGTNIQPSLELGQNSHDVAILLALKKFFNEGYIKPKFNFEDLVECQNSRSVNRFVLRKTETIIQFVDQHQMLTRKHLDYLDWKKIVEIKNTGLHKTVQGLDSINQILSKMNSKRDSNSEYN